MATSPILDQIVTEVKSRGQVQISDGIDDPTLRYWATNALTEHNPLYSDFSKLPSSEIEPVILLTWIRLTIVRAGKAAQDTNLSGPSGYGQDRSTPYTKLMNLATQLRSQYTLLCQKLGINPSNESLSVAISELVIPPTPGVGSLPTFFKSPNPPTAILNVETIGSDFVNINWTVDKENFDVFSAFILLISTGSEPIFQDWNYPSQSGVPRTSNLAIVLANFYQVDLRAAQVTQVDRTKDLRILMATRSTSFKWVYSNEVLIPHL